MTEKHAKTEYWRGFKLGIPVAIGYFACSITLGIMAAKIGIGPFAASLASLLLNASAGEFAFFTTIMNAGTYWEMALMELVTNARYLLMSCAIGQKMDPSVSLPGRLIIGFDLTDELFGNSIANPGPLTLPFYLGMMTLAVPGWALGTLFGALLGSMLPAVVITSLGMGLYGMFLATVVPASRRSHVIFFGVVLSMALSLALALIPLFSVLSSGVRVIILTVLVSSLLAFLFPVKDDPSEEDQA